MKTNHKYTHCVDCHNKKKKNDSPRCRSCAVRINIKKYWDEVRNGQRPAFKKQRAPRSRDVNMKQVVALTAYLLELGVDSEKIKLSELESVILSIMHSA